jgi:SAM-dependent methyltransferase
MSSASQTTLHNPEIAVRERYSAAAKVREESLCCPVDYDPQYLRVIPPDVLERDYGCGDPSLHVSEGETVVDLGSGGGKICFIAAQIVGPKGQVIGVEMNDEMLSLARGAAPVVAERIGYANVDFRRGRIQDLALSLDLLAGWLHEHPVCEVEHLSMLEDEADRLRRKAPLIPDGSVDIVVSNCVLNLVREEDKSRVIHEAFRILKEGGRIAISDIVSDEPVPERLKADPELWSGCVSGAFQECELLHQLEEVGFDGITLAKCGTEPFAVIQDISFRAVTVTARKGNASSRGDRNVACVPSPSASGSSCC